MSDNNKVSTYILIPKQMKQRGMNAEGYSSGSEYFRAMISAGESKLVNLDPHKLNSEDSKQSDVVDLDELLFDALTSEFAEQDEILENGLKNRISDRLLELAADNDNPIEKTGFEFRINE